MLDTQYFSSLRKKQVQLLLFYDYCIDKLQLKKSKKSCFFLLPHTERTALRKDSLNIMQSLVSEKLCLHFKIQVSNLRASLSEEINQCFNLSFCRQVQVLWLELRRGPGNCNPFIYTPLFIGWACWTWNNMLNKYYAFWPFVPQINKVLGRKKKQD